MWQQLLFPVLSLGGLGFIFGLRPIISCQKFEVETDPRIDDIREACLGLIVEHADTWLRWLAAAIVEEVHQ